MTTENMINKIRALLAKTVDAGCTEAEAIFAAAKAAALMDQYELSPDAITSGQTKASDTHYQRKTLDHAVRFCAKAVGLFTGTRIYSDNSETTSTTFDLFGEKSTKTEKGNHLRIVGLAHEVEIAGYILDICVNAMDASAGKALVAENAERARHDEPILLGGERKAWVDSYQRGMAVRLSETLREMAEKRTSTIVTAINAGAGNGRSLAIVRQDLIADWLKERGIVLHTNNRGRAGNQSGYAAGHAAGAGVRFHSGMASGQRAQMAIR